jgi:hypothetical protein
MMDALEPTGDEGRNDAAISHGERPYALIRECPNGVTWPE